MVFSSHTAETKSKAFVSPLRKSMLSELVSDEKLQMALEQTRRFPDCLTVHHAIQCYVKGRFPEWPTRVFLHADPSGSELWIVVRRSFNRVYVIISCAEASNFVQDLLWRSFDVLFGEISEWLQNGVNISTYGINRVIKMYYEWYRERSPGAVVDLYPTSVFYMTPEQMAHAQRIPNDLPHGYSLTTLDANEHAPVVMRYWKHALANELPPTSAKIRYMPSIGVKHDATGELLSFGLVEGAGWLHHLFTVPEHRRRGLGAVVETELCKACIGRDIVPYKFVEEWNESVLRSSRRSPLWTEWKDHDGSAVTLTFACVMLE